MMRLLKLTIGLVVFFIGVPQTHAVMSMVNVRAQVVSFDDSSVVLKRKKRTVSLSRMFVKFRTVTGPYQSIEMPQSSCVKLAGKRACKMLAKK